MIKPYYNIRFVSIFFISLLIVASCTKKDDENPESTDEEVVTDDEVVIDDILPVLDISYTVLDNSNINLVATLTEHNQTIVDFGFLIDNNKLTLGDSLESLSFETNYTTDLELFEEVIIESYVKLDAIDETIKSNDTIYRQLPKIETSSRDSYPGDKVKEHSGFLIDDNYYLTGGSHIYSTETKFCYRYNITTNTWVQLNDIPNELSLHVSFVIDDTAYLGLGYDRIDFPIYNYYDNIYKYNTLNDSWEEMNPFPGGPKAAALSFTIDGVGYIAGGSSGSKDLWQYDDLNDSWQQLGDLPKSAGIGNATITTRGSDAYLIVKQGSLTHKLYKYNSELDEWTEKQSFDVLDPDIGTPAISYFLSDDLLVYEAHTIFDLYGENTANGLWFYKISEDTWNNFPLSAITGSGSLESQADGKTVCNYNDRVFSFLGVGFLSHEQYGVNTVTERVYIEE